MPLNNLKAFSFIEWLKKDKTEIKLNSILYIKKQTKNYLSHCTEALLVLLEFVPICMINSPGSHTNCNSLL